LLARTDVGSPPASREAKRFKDAEAPHEKSIIVSSEQLLNTDSDTHGGDTEYSDDSCDENEMMTNVEHVTGFYSRATDSLREGIMHRIGLGNAALTEGIAATQSGPESPRKLELRELIRRASELSETMKTKQYKLIVISNGNGKTSVTNTLCGGMKVRRVRTHN
jgi:hypothetical protein